MTPLQESFLSLIRSSLWNSEFKCEEGVTAQELYREAGRYNILPLLSTKLDVVCASDPEVRTKWSKVAFANYIKMSKFLILQEELCNLLATIDVKPVFLKGLASAFYYPDPLLRSQDDIDFIVPPEQFDQTLELMLKNGFEVELPSARHIRLMKQGIVYELHHYFSLNRNTNDQQLDKVIFEGCRKCVTRTVNGHYFFTLPDDYYALALIEHMKHHVPHGSGFRQLLDWVFFTNSTGSDEFYNSSLKKKLQDNCLEQFAKVITKVSILFFEVSADNKTWCMDVDSNVCKQFIEFEFNCNNWGFCNNELNSVQSAETILKLGTLKVLKNSSRAHFPGLYNSVIFRPLAWLLITFRWTYKVLVKIAFKKGIAEATKKYNEKELLLKDFGL